MIERLTGTFATRLASSIILDVNGVGYGVEMPLSALCSLPAPGERVELWIETYVREDAIRLFGFLTLDDRQTFALLRSVSGVGPKIALALLSGLDGKQLRFAVLQGKQDLLEAVPGVGKRLAERLIVELRPKFEKKNSAGAAAFPAKGVGKAQPAAFDEFDSDESQSFAVEQVYEDVRSALENLGYRDKDLLAVMTRIRADQETSPDGVVFATVLKAALLDLKGA